MAKIVGLKRADYEIYTPLLKTAVAKANTFAKKFPHSLSADSFGRKTDRAVDLELIDEKTRKHIYKYFDERGN